MKQNESKKQAAHDLTDVEAPSEWARVTHTVGRWGRSAFVIFPAWIGKRICVMTLSCLSLLKRLTRHRAYPICCLFVCVAILLLAFACTISAAVCHKTGDRILTVEELTELEGEFDCILVLGCSVCRDGTPSPMLSDRVSTAVSLYQSGIAPVLLMSGDSQSPDYDETGAMQAQAIASGVPEEHISVDPMGLSTYDSIARLLRVWEVRRVVIVTQEYHLYRALYLAEKLGIEAYGISADQRSYAGQIKYDLREVIARCKDVFYAERQPSPAGIADTAE